MSGDGSSAMMRPILLWSGLGVLLLVAFLSALGAVQRTFYSPSGFVTAYVDALAAHDVTTALAMPGAAPTAGALANARLPENASRELLRADVLPDADLVIHEFGHIHPEKLNAFVKEQGIANMVITHIHHEWDLRTDELTQIVSEGHSGDVKVAHDGMRLAI